jgi:hypothetical protein
LKSPQKCGDFFIERFTGKSRLNEKLRAILLKAKLAKNETILCSARPKMIARA